MYELTAFTTFPAKTFPYALGVQVGCQVTILQPDGRANFLPEVPCGVFCTRAQPGLRYVAQRFGVYLERAVRLIIPPHLNGAAAHIRPGCTDKPVNTETVPR